MAEESQFDQSQEPKVEGIWPEAGGGGTHDFLVILMHRTEK